MYKMFADKSNDCIGIIILLPGRGQYSEEILYLYRNFSKLDKFTLVAIEPIEEWYPIPGGSKNQTKSILGLKTSIPQADKFISGVEKEFKIDRSKVILVGFSAGAVMAIQISANTKNPFSAVVVHNGAILETDSLPKSIHSTKYLVIHNKNDDCFSWKERYLPMKKTLIDNGYNLQSFENKLGGHYIKQEDIEKAGEWISQIDE